ncbi:uncharacterized protein LOC108146538 [Drosophila elegans]|uniref:uncharacterized protein LOC108146538 n=1 Tax=Drosophila elegans TaxID=30023 RepID=UPI0007E6958C|nr:uncharacterized protein LOC108146538 [Drosophila elegans]
MFLWHFLSLLCLAFVSNEAKSIKKSHVNLLEPTFDQDDKLGRIGISPPDISNNVQRVQQVPWNDPPDKDHGWQGKWFPHVPGDPQDRKQSKEETTTTETVSVAPLEMKTKDNWQGKWFPQAPGAPHLVRNDSTSQEITSTTGAPHVIKKKPLDGWNSQEAEEKSTTEEVKIEESSTQGQDVWQGKWFPQGPNEPHKTKPIICDDGKSNLAVDYDPNDISDSLNYLCITSNRSLYQPNLTRAAILTEHFLPSAYLPPAKCLSERINYSHLPVTNGAYRPLPAEYGSYSYLPPQRYVRNLAEGAIVMLYHPCAFPGQVKQLQDMVGGCLYRHLITPSQALTPERPLALLAWSRSLEMSVVDQRLAVEFIQKHAKQGPLAPEEMSRVVDKRETYKEGLLTEAHLVTTADDYELCGYLQEGM